MQWSGFRRLIVVLFLASCVAAACAGAPPGSPLPEPAASSPFPTSVAFAATPTFTPFQPLPVIETVPETQSPDTPFVSTQAAPEASPAGPAVPVETSTVAVPSEPPKTVTPAGPSEPAEVLTPAGPALTLWVDPALPAALPPSLALPSWVALAGQPEKANLRLEVGTDRVISRWVYALVAPFPSFEEVASMEELSAIWRGEAAGRPLFLDETTYAVFSAWWGAPGEGSVSVFAAGELLEKAWNSRPVWAIVPFEALEPRWKVLPVDGLSPVRKGFDPAAYPLALPISLAGPPAVAETVFALHGPGAAAPLAPPTNRDPDRLTTLALTGVTALVRATAFTMEQQDIQYPGRDVGEWLREADLTHISNEVPFARNCPAPNPVQADVRFCSDPRYIALLEEMGTDIVELTGDHFQDWGEAAMLETLDMYRERGWLYYGGGADLEEGRRAVTVEHNGNKLAFLGCNGKGGAFAQAGPGRPGAVTCDPDWMHAEIARLRQEGYLPIVTFQHFEYYTYQAQPNQKKDFRGMAQAGAVIVSGSQAHQPQAMEFDSGAFIHYGLGNLFFDQYDVSLACRQAFIDRHVFYAGRHISTELLPILFIDYARPRPMTTEERLQLLEAVFAASGW